MGKLSKQRTGLLIKGYLSVRVKLPDPPVGSGEGKDETFFFVKEHREGNPNNVDRGAPPTLFVANAPIVPGLKTNLLLKALLGRFGDIGRVTLVENPRTGTSVPSANLKPFSSSFLPPIHGSEKFAHVVFTSSLQMRRTLISLSEIMEAIRDKKRNSPCIEFANVELQVLKDESERLHCEGIGEEVYEKERKEEISGILEIAQRYRSSMVNWDRAALLAKCNDVVQDYENREDSQRLAREATAGQPDEDGFITVASKSVGVEGCKLQLEKDQGAHGKRRRDQKRNRKKKESIGAAELQDFYRFQRKELRKRTLQDLRMHFEEDLKKVKKVKDEHQYKPF